MPFWSDIPGRPETQVGRWHAMRKKGDEKRSWGGSELALLEEENVDWESVWNRSVAGNALPASLRELRCVSSLAHVGRELIFQLRQADVHTIVTLTDNAPQGLNQALSSSFVHATQVGTPSSVQLYKLSLINQS